MIEAFDKMKLKGKMDVNLEIMLDMSTKSKKH